VALLFLCRHSGLGRSLRQGAAVSGGFADTFVVLKLRLF